MRNEGSTGTKRVRHAKVKASGSDHLYYSVLSDGTKKYEVRHPLNSEGKRPFEVVGTRIDQAKARARVIYADADKGVQVTNVGTTLNEVVQDWRETRRMRPRSEQTFDDLLDRHVLPVLGRRKVREIGKFDLVRLLDGLKRRDGKEGPLSGSTQHLILSTVYLVLQHAVDLGVLSVVPRVDKARRPKRGESRKRVVSHDEESRLLFACGYSPWLRPIVTVALHEALRLGEVCCLRWEDVDFPAGKLTVQRSLSRDGSVGVPKGGRTNVIELTPKAKQALLALRGECDGTGFVFLNRLGEVRQVRDVQRAFRKAVVRAELDDGVCFHTLRHTSISRVANNASVALVHVQAFARHANLKTTSGYIHPIESPVVATAIGQALTGRAA